MRLLLDTHALLWWLDGDERLSLAARQVIGDPATEVLVSAASAWEIATKHRIGKLPGATAVALDVAGCVAAQGFVALDVTLADGQRAGALRGEHRDPFDRMLVAQALRLDVPLVTNDTTLEAFGIRRLW